MNEYLIDRLRRFLKFNFGSGQENGAELIREAIESLTLGDAVDEHFRSAIMSASAELELYNMGCGGSPRRAFAHIRHALEDAPGSKAAGNEPRGLTCSFCHKAPHQVRVIVASGGPSICDECVALCSDVIAHAQAIEARQGGNGEAGAVHESAVSEGDAP